ncbi:Gamma response gene 1, putative isoform 1 [Theobroma cacao]|uniref:Gamma response gene 1, putative isoform 1 n=1 Tax=Theobroma cacao TaxID=3641 RepID=A0A061DXE2_THECC|nr:Gamma response gene 1, putative isoform 1 [Theobroma cacao]
MEGHLEQSPKLGLPIDSDCVKYISGLSTILVATIQEAKDRISQIEYIFCSQLYPNFQLKSNGLQKIYTEIKKAAEDAWKEKENEFILQIEKLELEKKQALEENHSFTLEREKLVKEQEEKMSQLLVKLRCQERIEELKGELMLKSKEVDEGIELQNKLVQLVQTKASVIANKNKEVKEHEEKTNVLLSDLNSLQKKVEALQQELREKTQEVADRKKLSENLLKKIELQSFDIMHNEEQLINCNNEKKLVVANFEKLKESYDELHVVHRKKTKEVEEGRKLQEQLLRQIDLKGSEMLKNKQQLEEQEKKKELLAKVKVLEEKVNELQAKLRESGDDAAEERDSYEKLLKQIESKSADLMAEKKKKRDLLDAYKRLKSQYNFLCRKNGLTTENMTFPNKLEDESDSARHHHNPKPSLGNYFLLYPIADAENKILNTRMIAHDTKGMKDVGLNVALEDGKGAKSFETSSSHSPTSRFPTQKCPSSVKSNPIAGTKRPVSGWRDTRSHQCQAGPDPHDDFLDTPLENIRGNLKKAMKEEAGGLPVPEDMNVDSSDDETQDVSVDKRPREQEIPFQMADKGSFKYVEPVRKKADREKLRGFECNQCKKFYDAVLNNGDQDNEDHKKNFRCEHHDGVSRHRYKYVPPMTPEGFWNIGFESEM